ncbi:MAG: patatin-like phospholipase family protein [Rubrobacteraceae bacterium]
MPEAPEDKRDKRVDLVFEGGGVKGIGLVGAFSVLEEHGYGPQGIAGSSGGAVLAALLAAGYTAAELREILLELDFESLRDKAWEDRIPFLGTPLSLLKDQGLYEGKALLKYMRGLLAYKGVRTFGDLIEAGYTGQARLGNRVQMIASDISTRSLLVLPRDASRLGIEDPGSLEVALAVRMSAGIPFYFEPVKFRNPKTGRDHLIVDGGVLSNFPVWLFDTGGEPRWPTFGLKLVEPDPRAPLAYRIGEAGHPTNKIEATIDYVKSLVLTVIEAHDRLYIETADFVRTICIPTLGIRTTDFDLSRERKLELYEAGRDAAERFLKTWSFEDYKKEFRQGDGYPRGTEAAGRTRRGADEDGH